MHKSLFILVVVGIIAMASPLQVSSQAFRSVDEDVTIDLKDPATGEVLYTFSAGVERILITPSGNFLRTVKFSLDAQNPVMDFSGPRKILEVAMFYDIDEDGVEEKIVDTMAVVTKSGNLKLVYLSNGAGSRLPPGWDF